MTATGFIVTGMIPLVLAAVAVGPVTLVLHFCHHPAKQCAPELRGKKCMNTFTVVFFLGAGFTSSKRNGFMVPELLRAPLC